MLLLNYIVQQVYSLILEFESEEIYNQDLDAMDGGEAIINSGITVNE